MSASTTIPSKPSRNTTSALLPHLLSSNVLAFGTFTLKSGRISPYFFTSSNLHTASLTRMVADAYASLLCAPPFSVPSTSTTPTPQFNTLFGPAYKGIPLVASICTSPHILNLTQSNSPNDHAEISWSFNRKEAKSHGERGMIVGCPLAGRRVIVIDDVLTAGTALREAVGIIRAQGGTVVGVALLLDREERVSESEPRSACKVAEDELGVPVRAVVKFGDLIGAVERGEADGVGMEEVQRMKEYRRVYGSQD